MIAMSELFVGAYVKLNGAVTKVTRVNENVTVAKKGMNVAYYLLMPIPLTAEWVKNLLKCECRMEGTVEVWTVAPWLELRHANGAEVWLLGGLKVRYVHQLQYLVDMVKRVM